MSELLVVLLMCYLVQGITSDDIKCYLREREYLKIEDRNQAIGYSLNLTSAEEEVNKILMTYKEAELTSGLRPSANYPMIMDPLLREDILDHSKVFEFLRRMPKGALLHVHSTSLASVDYVLSLTYWDNLYVCMDEDKPFQFRFFGCPDQTCNWLLVKDVRKTDPFFDAYIKQKLTIDTAKEYKDTLEVWQQADQISTTLSGLVKYKPVFEAHFKHSLEEMYNDGLIYVEIRSGLSGVYDLDGTTYNSTQIVAIYKRLAKNFKAKHCEFMGVRMIYSVWRGITDDQLKWHLEDYQRLREDHGDFIAGFDIVGFEDTGRRLLDFAEQLNAVAGQVPLYFHAGETLAFGGADENLFDAILLGARRIGHASALMKHPALLRRVVDADICIEVTPVGDQILMYDDARTNSAVIMAAFGLTLVVANDNPTLYGTKAVSEDWYMMLMAMLHRTDGLRALKQLALNSLRKSAMTNCEMDKAVEIFDKQWRRFIHHYVHK